MNNHPLISICLCHGLHPYNKKSRLVVYMCITIAAFLVSVILLQNSHFGEVLVCQYGCNERSVVQSIETSQNVTICFGGSNNGMLAVSYQNSCKYYQPWMISAACGAVLLPYGSFLQFLATCGCFKGQNIFDKYCICGFIKRIVESFGSRVLSLISCKSLVSY